MKKLVVAAALAVAVAACTEKPAASPNAAAPKPAAKGDVEAGKKTAEADCKRCHGVDGKSVAPAIPHLAGQSDAYLLAALNEYQQGKRTHSALREIATRLDDAGKRNIAAYYASLPPAGAQAAAPTATPYDRGKEVSKQCASCHSEDGNAKQAGVPSLAGQQPRYLVAAISEYLNGERKTSPMHAKLRGAGGLEIENVALYFASQAPATRTTAPKGDPKAGEPLAAVCGGCHGMQGVSPDSATPSLAGQDEAYLADAIKAYRTSRKREKMRAYITGLADRDVGNIAAFYAVQRSRAPENGRTLVQEFVERCNKCHGPGVQSAMPIPRIQGQDKDYLVMALREYRDDRRESTTMHRMSLPYGDSIIESISAYYAGQPVK
jgi:cytochrome c553